MSNDLFIKAHPHAERGKVWVELNAEGVNVLERLISRVQPLKNDTPENVQRIKDRITGVLWAAKSQRGME